MLYLFRRKSVLCLVKICLVLVLEVKIFRPVCVVLITKHIVVISSKSYLSIVLILFFFPLIRLFQYVDLITVVVKVLMIYLSFFPLLLVYLVDERLYVFKLGYSLLLLVEDVHYVLGSITIFRRTPLAFKEL